LSNGDAGDITIQPASGYAGGFPIGKIIINADLSAASDGNFYARAGSLTGSDGTVTLSANRASAATVATITSSVIGNDISCSVGNLVMGPYEAMTALGSITLSATANLTLGDVVAMTNLSLLASSVIQLNVHGDQTLLDNLGGFYTSPSLHFFGGAFYVQSGTLVPAGPLDARALEFSAGEFRTLLLYGDPTILNYDTGPRPGPAVPVSLAAKQFAMYQLSIATAQLSDLLPTCEPTCPPIERYKWVSHMRQRCLCCGVIHTGRLQSPL
jgi:hypothetical protein